MTQSRMDSLMPESEINALLSDRIEELAREIFPAARRAGNEMVVGSLAGEPGKSLSIHIGKGSTRGVWRDFSAGIGGDALKLVCLAQFGGDYKRAVPWAKAWLGIDDADPALFKKMRAQAAEQNKQRAAAELREREQKRKAAHALWLEGRPLERGDLVDRYLLNRGIDLGALEHAPGVLRFHEGLTYWGYDPEQAKAVTIATLPAMVTAITDLQTGRFLACHRTWLKTDGSAKAGEAELGRDHRNRPRDAKKVLGPYKGGHIKLWLGQGDDGARLRGPLRRMRGEQLHLSEGIEDGLTAACADPWLTVAAMISLGNLVDIVLPEQARTVVMLKQNDPPDSPAAATYLRGVERLRGEDRRVLEVVPPAGIKDINDLARAAASGDWGRA